MDSFLLVRHAPTHLDPAIPAAQWQLTADAANECRRLAAQLSPLEPSIVITSEEPKAAATGAILAEAWGAPCLQAEGLQEHDRTGVPFVPDQATWHRLLETLFKEQDNRILGRESGSEALARFEEALRRELDAHPQRMPVLVSHATVMSLFVARHNALDAFGFWRTLRMPEALHLRRTDFLLVARYGPASKSRD